MENKKFAAWVNSRDFLKSRAWQELRYLTIRRYGGRCQCCGRVADEGAVLNVDHIRPRFTHPHLALNPDNLQVLCRSCNRGKGRRDVTDWRRGRRFPLWLTAVYAYAPWALAGAVIGGVGTVGYLALREGLGAF